MAESERDPRVSSRYRELGREEPPPELDAAILAASRHAAEAHPAPLVAPTGRRRWYFPVAAAAIIVLAAAVTFQMDRQQSEPDMPVAATPAPSSLQAPEAKSSDAANKAQRADAKAVRRTGEARRQAAPSFAPEPPAQTAQAERPASAASAVAARSETRAARLTAQAESPERALERIAELRRQGRHEEADKALAEFRKRYPDYRIAPETLEKVEKK